MVVQAPALDRVFKALADPTRRDVVMRVLEREHSVTELAQSYEMSFAAVQKHVAVLERAGLVRKRRVGREARVLGEVAAVRRATELLSQMERIWARRIDAMGELVAALGAEEADPITQGDER